MARRHTVSYGKLSQAQLKRCSSRHDKDPFQYNFMRPMTLTHHVRRLQQLKPKKFVQLPTANQIVLYYWDRVVQATNGPPELIQDAPTAVFPVRFLLQAMVLFKENLSRWMPFRKGGLKTETSIDCLWELWPYADESRPALSQEFVEDAVRLLVTRFIPLNLADLEGWMSDPEEWVNLEDKEDDQWEYEFHVVNAS
ncbi:uncharacterized protein F5147DRAFT_772483 [Suillus discolor]|uniref:Uncharacterized protein n=1 Tax=Suillus discolor TaxID=1912936 RepID=A0A9P7F805_9AGAM|nr:uncharacterized protein F5147DRAFT_772483 [Suillus discolor]KAG2110216.1 hypothetical protein F5147DRAFT_772483 [Suillus discolor]